MKEIEYDISMIDCLINALMQHYEEKPIPNYSNIRNELSDKQLKLLHLVYSFFTSGTLFYWEDGLMMPAIQMVPLIISKLNNLVFHLLLSFLIFVKIYFGSLIRYTE